MHILAAIVVSLIAASGQADPLRAGVMVASVDRPVLALEGAPVAVGTVVTIVGLDEPQQVWRASIGKQMSSSDLMTEHALHGPFYELTPEAAISALPRLAVVILGSAQVARQGAEVALRFPAPYRNVRVRSCASSEGLHLTLWAGTPLKSQRLWHVYCYLGYDVEPTCLPADMSTTPNQPSRPIGAAQ